MKIKLLGFFLLTVLLPSNLLAAEPTAVPMSPGEMVIVEGLAHVCTIADESILRSWICTYPEEGATYVSNGKPVYTTISIEATRGDLTYKVKKAVDWDDAKEAIGRISCKIDNSVMISNSPRNRPSGNVVP